VQASACRRRVSMVVTASGERTPHARRIDSESGAGDPHCLSGRLGDAPWGAGMTR
jgi:hypothetical protein